MSSRSRRLSAHAPPYDEPKSASSGTARAQYVPEAGPRPTQHDAVVKQRSDRLSLVATVLSLLQLVVMDYSADEKVGR